MRLAKLTLVIAVAYILFAYVVAPMLWDSYEAGHPSLDETPRITMTSDGHPGDPLNVALIGNEEELKEIMRLANWYAADALGFESDFKISADTILKKEYDDAPVSNLYLFGRKEDFAFEQPAADNPRRRHHVRFWKTKKSDDAGRPLWIGSASYDKSVGLSHTTGQVTHHIAADVDVERDYLFRSLEQTQKLSGTYDEQGFHALLEGRNGGGDIWHTDGDLRIGVIAVY